VILWHHKSNHLRWNKNSPGTWPNCPFRFGSSTTSQKGGGGWYQWKALFAGTGDCGTFADAVIQAIAYVQQQQGIQKLAAPEAHRKIERTTLEACLQRVRKVQATPLLYLHLGETGWLTSKEAAHSIRVNRFLDLEREAYLIEQDEGPGRPAGIYLQAANGWSYRAFDVEI